MQCDSYARPWCFPLKMEELTKALGPQDYETKTMGSRHVEPARVLGEGALPR